LLVAHDEIPEEIAIYNDYYKFIAYSHSILQEFAIDDDVTFTIHFKTFSPKTVRKIHARCTGFYRVLRRIASITHELDIPWDPVVNLVFSGEDMTLFYARMPVSRPPPWPN